MLDKIYLGLHKLFSKPEERGEYSAGYWQNQIRLRALKLCPENKAATGRLLEIGCGEGLFLEQLAQQLPGFELWGIDNSARRIQQASKRFAGRKINLSAGDATELSFSNGYFDIVVCINVFFNMASLDMVQKTLEEMSRVVKVEGTIIFDFRNGANPLLALKYALAPLYDKTVRDLPLKTYRLRQFEELLEKCQLNISEKIFIGSSWEKAAAVIMIKARKR